MKNVELLGHVTLAYMILTLISLGYSRDYWIFNEGISQYKNEDTWKYLIRKAGLNDSTIQGNMYDILRLRSNPSINSIEILRILFLKWILISLDDLIGPWKKIKEQRKNKT